MSRLADSFGRRFHYLRLSVTEVCNFRCAYCLPDGWARSAPLSFLSLEEVGRLLAAFTDLGLSKVRLTGGEPTVRRDIDAIIARVASTPGVAKTALTTNGWTLARRIADWRRAGLNHLNVSVDSLDPEVFRRITGHDRLDEILAGVDAALGLDFAAVKLNAVLLRDTADGFGAFEAFVRERPLSVRFIELMRTNDNADYFARQHLGGQALRDWLDARGWRPLDRAFDAGPAIEYAHPDHAGRIGLIAPYAPGFCDSCNRLRVTARGKLRLCLFGEGGADLRDLLQSDDDREALVERIAVALGAKTAGHRLHEGVSGDTRQLAEVGG
jgi:cyclic pyranopterin phosphate synthase